MRLMPNNRSASTYRGSVVWVIDDDRVTARGFGRYADGWWEPKCWKPLAMCAIGVAAATHDSWGQRPANRRATIVPHLPSVIVTDILECR